MDALTRMTILQAIDVSKSFEEQKTTTCVSACSKSLIASDVSVWASITSNVLFFFFFFFLKILSCKFVRSFGLTYPDAMDKVLPG